MFQILIEGILEEYAGLSASVLVMKQDFGFSYLGDSKRLI